MSAIKFLVCFLLCVFKVNSMALKGPPLTRYGPCGLGVIHFDRITENIWQGVVNLGLYTNLNNSVSFEVDFEKNVEVYGASVQSSYDVKNSWRDYLFQINGTVPSTYVFFIKSNDTGVPEVNRFSLNNQVLCNKTIKLSETVESFNVTKDDQHYRHVCGRRSLSHTELTSVRTEAEAGDWPWHVAIFIRDATTNNTRYECGGNIISRTAIVTAGHCVYKAGKLLAPYRIVIVAGINNVKDKTQIGRQELNAETVVLHPNYKDWEASADLAVIKVNKLAFTDYVQPICVWGPVYDKTNLYGYQATVVGFGAKEDNKQSDILRSAYTLVQNDTTCINYDFNLYTPLLNEFTFCAGFGPTAGINPRNGDSGGGLVIPTMQPDHKISWFLRGVLSKCGVVQGQTLCDPRFYTIYTDVGPHYGWLYHHSGLRFTSNILTNYYASGTM